MGYVARPVPLPFLLPAVVFFGLCHALMAEGALGRGGERRLLIASSLFGAVIVLPVEAYLLHDYADWAYLYTLRPSRIPSAIDLLFLLAATALVPASAALGARWLARDARHLVLRLALASFVVSAAGGISCWRRLTHYGTYAQYKGGYGLRTLTESSLGPSLLLALAVFAAGLVVSTRALRS